MKINIFKSKNTGIIFFKIDDSNLAVNIDNATVIDSIYVFSITVLERLPCTDYQKNYYFKKFLKNNKGKKDYKKFTNDYDEYYKMVEKEVIKQVIEYNIKLL